MTILRRSKLYPTLIGILGLYLLGYAVARWNVFHTVENYGGAEGKGLPRQDYITKVNQPAGEGWEYQLFRPVIKIEEGITNFFHNRKY